MELYRIIQCDLISPNAIKKKLDHISLFSRTTLPNTEPKQTESFSWRRGGIFWPSHSHDFDLTELHSK